MNCLTAPRFLFACFTMASLTGCGDGGSGRFRLSGTVTYGEAPVPGGRILFVPDTNKGGEGPGAVADITNGSFVTRPGRGVTSGPHQVTIYGTDGTQATQTHDNSLFPPHTLEVELSAQSTEIHLTVPKL